MRFAVHPLWLAGFRPFFALACLSGLSLPAIWVLMYSGTMAVPATSFSALQWHAHEMFFGFAWAALGGFLLTSTKNWVRIRGYHGGALAFLATAWLFERAGMWWEGVWPPLLFRLSNNLFLAAIVAMLLWTFIRHRDSDAYRGDNNYFIAVLPAFVAAKYLLLSADGFAIGWGMCIALFRVAFLVMLERTLTQFMKGIFQADVLRDPRLDHAIKFAALVLVGADLMPAPLASGIAALLAALLAVRFAYWQPRIAMRRLDVGIMYLGYLAIVAQLLLEALGRVTAPGWVGNVAVHVFAFGAMGLVFPAMVIRISRGHTGRKVVFDGPDKLALRIMILALLFRVVGPQLHPSGYIGWLALAAACWFAGFGLLAWRYIPYLVQPRVDGKEH